MTLTMRRQRERDRPDGLGEAGRGGAAGLCNGTCENREPLAREKRREFEAPESVMVLHLSSLEPLAFASCSSSFARSFMRARVCCDGELCLVRTRPEAEPGGDLSVGEAADNPAYRDTLRAGKVSKGEDRTLTSRRRASNNCISSSWSTGSIHPVCRTERGFFIEEGRAEQ